MSNHRAPDLREKFTNYPLTVVWVGLSAWVTTFVAIMEAK